MARFAQILPWLRAIFPPADAAGQLNPSEISEDISLVHPLFTGTELLARGTLEIDELSGRNGFRSVVLIPRDPENCFAVFYAQVTHSDPIAQFIFFDIQVMNAAFPVTVTDPEQRISNRPFVLQRVIIVPQNTDLRIRAEALSVGTFLSGRVIFARFPPGRTVTPF